MAKTRFIPPRLRHRNRRVICVPAAKRDAANAEMAKLGFGKDFFSIPLYNPADKKVKEYAADVTLTDEQLAVIEKISTSILEKEDIVTPVNRGKGSSVLKEVAAKRNVAMTTIAGVV